MQHNRLSKNNVGLLVIDMQEKLFPHVERATEILAGIQTMIKGCQSLSIPIFVTEQYPKGLGETIQGVTSCFKNQPKIYDKTSFSCVGDKKIKEVLLDSSISQWILVGIEAHVCVLQSAYDLMENGKQVAVLNDAISSRSLYDYSTAIAEMRDFGVRISCIETVLFELVNDSQAKEFKYVSELIQ